eukprot:gene11441-12637_t
MNVMKDIPLTGGHEERYLKNLSLTKNCNGKDMSEELASLM